MIEVRQDRSKWGATPKIFYAKEEAKEQVEVLKLKHPFISEFRIVTRKIEEER